MSSKKHYSKNEPVFGIYSKSIVMQKTRSLCTIIFFVLFTSFYPNVDFKADQLKASRVKQAYSEKWTTLKTQLHQLNIDTNSFNIFIRIFKKEAKLELWTKSSNDTIYKLFNSYDICASSGELGPKRKQGDGQVPEGFYEVSVFNPYSSYHLSLGINYPNQSDRIIGGKGDLGGDIMIHGNCVTIGCVPLTDDKIKEVYILAVEARSKGQAHIQVHSFPCRMGSIDNSFVTQVKVDGWQGYSGTQYVDLLHFWTNISTGYYYFESNKKLPIISVDKEGKYIFK